ncbi:VOC family protein [Pontixanthobacter aquaemixtae]|uniref:VOC family protein n=1 Tax=Pontixanthobacter aquaemixtae TaxID=1958940 RepID=A0A844ZQ85_9SPHN|nr:VOC family protein [Pontixanthobacter aquaemixtae]MXO89704.1 VOC family protein [Pontixanthobacter aquaemixtae]
MADKHGDFVWYELMTPDPDAAQTFYGGLLGWEFEEAGFNGQDYRSFKAGDAQVGGFLKMTKAMEDHGARASWVGYVRVDDVPAAVEQARGAGGHVFMEGGEVPDVGPFAMLADPQGAPFYVIDDRSGQPSDAFAKHTPREGVCAWNELATSDPDAADTFYRGLFGWEKGDAMDMGPIGLYQMYQQDDYGLGAMMKKPDEMPVSLWAFYFRVPEILAAKTLAESNGAQIVNGPMEIPGGDYIVQGFDPQGAFFSLIGAKGS